MKKEYIHIVNGEGGIYLDIVVKLFVYFEDIISRFIHLFLWLNML